MLERGRRAGFASDETCRLIHAHFGGSSAERDLPEPPWTRVGLGRANIDCLSSEEAILVICEIASIRERREYVVTPNIQHVALLERDAEFERAYDDAALVLPDGTPVALAVRALTHRKQSRVTGADLLPGVCRAAASRDLTVGLMGGRPNAAQAAALRLKAKYPGLNVTLVDAAPYGFEEGEESLNNVLDHVTRANPNILFVGLGTPKAELFLHRHRDRLGTGIALSVGAAIDFAAGVVDRAPEAWQRAGCEWLYRLLKEPGRLGPRYAKAAPTFLAVSARTMWSANRRR